MNLPSASWVEAGTMPPGGRPDAWRRLGVTVGIVALYLLGRRVPLPVDPLVQSQNWGYLNAYMPPPQVHRFSIFVVGFGPIFSVLYLFELARSLIPPLRRWTDRDVNAKRLNIGIRVLILVFATLSSLGIVATLGRAHLFPDDSDWLLKADVFITVIVGTMLTLWFCDLIDNYGLGNGFWLLYLVPVLTQMLAATGHADDWFRQYDAKAVACLIAAPCIAIGLIVIAWTAKYRPTKRTGLALGTRPKITMRQFEITPDLWIPVLAPLVPGTLLGLLAYIFGTAFYEFLNRFISVTMLYDIMPIFFILIFTWLRQPQTIAQDGARHTLPIANRWLFAFAQVIIFAGISLVLNWYKLPPILSPTLIIVLTVLALNYRAVFFRP